jgi:5-methylcytosine-specific restriction endonuclease McrA
MVIDRCYHCGKLFKEPKRLKVLSFYSAALFAPLTMTRKEARTMLKLCLSCSQPIKQGSRCKPCQEKYRPAQARFNLPALVKQRDGNKCKNCGGVNGLEVHHITPLYLGGDNSARNLITLCQKCHEGQHG